MKNKKENAQMASADCKNCNKCGLNKTLDSFRKDKRRKSGYKSICKVCADLTYKARKAQFPELIKEQRRAQHLRHKYGMSVDSYNSLLKAQDEKCAACGTQSPLNSLYKRLVVDHNHSTGQVRGLLCHSCNSTIGASREDVYRLSKIIDYLNINNK